MTRIKGPGWDAWPALPDYASDELKATDTELLCVLRRTRVRFPLPGWWAWRRWHRAGHPTETIPTPDYRPADEVAPDGVVPWVDQDGTETLIEWRELR